MKKIALIFGITGQDGSYLAEFLLKKNYIVHGVKRRSSSINTGRIDHIYQDPHVQKRSFILHYGDITDSLNVTRLIKQIKPDEIYNLAAQSHVAVSFESPEYTANADALGTLRILEAIRFNNLIKKTKFYQAGTSEMFGKVMEVPQNENTPFYPRSPYGVAKVYAHWITVNYREAYKIFACNGILFNHESPVRGETFVTKKIIMALCRIKLNKQKKSKFKGDFEKINKKDIHSISENLYEKGYSALDIIEYIKDLDIDQLKKYEYLVYIQKIKKEFREEKLLMSSILHFLLKRSDYTLENISFM